MKGATRITVSTFGIVAGLAGIEHGLGEIWQGNVAPDGVVFESWAGSELFEILAGEPAMSIVPNLLVTGILAILVSAAFLVWVTRFVHTRLGGPVLIGLSVILLLVGGGFGPPVLGLILGLAATRIGAPFTWSREHVPAGVRRVAGRLWPWLYAASLIAWLSLLPGTILVNHFVALRDPYLMAMVLPPVAFASLALAILTAFARDMRRRDESVAG